MITRYNEVTDSLEKQFISLCCQEEIDLTIIPCLNRIYNIKINKPGDFLLYTHLIEKIILSCATLHRLRDIKIKLRNIDEKPPGLINEIVLIKENMHAKDRYRRLFDLYFHGQTKMNTALTTTVNIFNYRSKLIEIEELILAASSGLSHVKKISSLELPLTTSCYIKSFNEKLNQFFSCLAANNDLKKQLYQDIHDNHLSESDFTNAITILMSRIRLATGFIDRYLSEETFSKEDPALKNKLPDNYQTLLLALLKNIHAQSNTVSAMLAR